MPVKLSDDVNDVLGHLIEWPLCDTGVGAEIRNIHHFLRCDGGKDDDVNVLEVWTLAHDPAKSFAADIGHNQIDKDDVRHKGLHGFQG